MAEQMTEPMENLNAVLKGMAEILAEKENLEELTKLGPDLRSFVADLRKQADTLTKTMLETTAKTQGNLDRVTASVTATSEEVRALLQKNRPALEKLLEDSDALMARLNKTADGLEDLVKDADGLVKDADRVVVENHGNIHETIRALRDTVHHMEMATRRIRANPAILIFGADETPEERRRADETELRLKGRARRYDKEPPK